MKQLQTKLNRFLFLGMALAYSQDVLPQFKYSIAKNIRQYLKGVITQRAGMTPINASAVAATNIINITRLNDDTPTASQAYARIIAGANGVLYSDNSAHNAFTSRSTSYSGNPLTLAVFRPNNTPSPYCYIGDTAKMEKINVAGSVSKMGISPPTTAPTISVGSPTLTVIDALDATTGWSTGGNATTLTALTAFGNIDVSNILYDSGTTGWCSINFNTVDGTSGSTLPAEYYQEGRRIRLYGASTEYITVDKVLPEFPTTTVESVTYDSGTTGLCTIVPTASGHRRLVKDILIKIDSEFVRVLSVTIGDDDRKSFRCSTTSNHTATAPIVGYQSIRAYTTNNITTSHNADFANVAFSASAAGVSYITKSSTLDLTNISGRAIQDTDEICFILYFNSPELVTEVQLMMDFDIATNDFTRNYYLKTIRPSELNFAAQQTLDALTVQQRKIQSDVVDGTQINLESRAQYRERMQRDYAHVAQEDDGSGDTGRGGGGGSSNPNPPRKRKNRGQGRYVDPPPPPIFSGAPTTIGKFQVAVVRTKVSEWVKVGSDATRGLKDIKALRILVITTAAASTVVNCSSWWIGGTYGADISEQGLPYIHRYRYRSSTTGAKSYWSPPVRTGIEPRRQRVQLTAVASADAQVDKIDWARFGGVLEDWHIIGIGANSTAIFNDDFPDDVVSTKPIATFDSFVPFVVADLPRTGTVNVSGTKVTRASGDTFNTKWAEGSAIYIDGVRCTLYGSPTSTTVLDINQNMGTKSAVAFFMPEPIIADTPLPAIWASMEGDKANVIFGCGDTLNAGTCYYTNPDDPDSSSDFNLIEVCPPTEPLMNGFSYDARNYVWSSDNLYMLYPIAKVDGSLGFTSHKTPLGRGLAGRYAFCLGEGGIWFVDKDGIYVTNGSQPISITDEDLYPLFPHDGQVGTTTNGVIAPDFSSPNNLRLSVGDGYLRFDYLGTDTNRYTLVYDIVAKSWLLDQYTPGVVCSYFEQGRSTHNWLIGATDGRLYTNTGQGDGASSNTAISCQLRTKAEDLDNPRARKFWGDGSLEFEVSNTALAVTTTIGLDNYTTLLTPVANTLASANVRKQVPLEINSGDGAYSPNATLDIAWSSGTHTAKLYNWSFSFDPAFSEDTRLRATAPDNAGYEGAKWVQGFRIRANSYNIAKTFKVQADKGSNGLWEDSNVAETFTATFTNESTQAFSFSTPFIAHNMRLLGTDTDDWSVEEIEWIYDIEPELVSTYKTQQTTHSLKGYQHIGDLYITLLSSADVTLRVTIDGTNYDYTLSSTAGARSKLYVRTKAIKGKLHTYSLTSANGFRLYQKDCEIRVKSWNGEAYQVFNPFGEQSFTQGARV